MLTLVILSSNTLSSTSLLAEESLKFLERDIPMLFELETVWSVVFKMLFWWSFVKFSLSDDWTVFETDFFKYILTSAHLQSLLLIEFSSPTFIPAPSPPVPPVEILILFASKYGLFESHFLTVLALFFYKLVFNSVCPWIDALPIHSTWSTPYCFILFMKLLTLLERS